jgi:Cdc6-like AAA superfamily ATPase
MLDMGRNVEYLSRNDQQSERNKIADWFAPSSFADQQNDYLAQRHAGTGTWLCKNSQYEHWCRQADNTLLCPGIPGSGKTVMVATIVDDLQRRFREQRDVVVVYFYCNFNRSSEQQLHQILASLVRQLFQEQPHVPEPVQEIYRKHQARRTRPNLEEIKKLLRVLVQEHVRVFIVVDALDECNNTDKVCDKLLNEFFELQQQNTMKNLNILATTRFVPQILHRFLAFPQIEIRAQKADIERYLDARMPELTNCVQRNERLQQDVKTQITGSADGM